MIRPSKETAGLFANLKNRSISLFHLLPTFLLASAFLGVTILDGADKDTVRHQLESSRPNVVMIIADDLSYRDLGFLGNQKVHTPNIDRLASVSAVYPNGYVPMSVCRPSLATLLTGLYPHQHGIHFNHPPPGLRAMREMTAKEYRRARSSTDYLIEQVANLPRLLAKQGYACLQTGKHWEGDFRTAGFTDGMTTGRPSRRLSSITGTREQLNGEWVAHGNGDEGLTIGRETMKPIQSFLSKHAGKKPFFIWYAPFLPHTPFDAPQRYRDLMRDKKIEPHLQPYYAEIARFDDTVGNLITQLKQSKALDNTLVVFVSDNGFRPDKRKNNRQNSRSKLSVYEDGIRTPILLFWKNRIIAKTHSELVQSVDLLPTILSATGLSKHKTKRMQGIDLIPSAMGNKRLPQRPAFGAIYPNDATELGKPSQHVVARWIRKGKYKLVFPTNDPKERKPARQTELFDLIADPLETKNLAQNRSMRTVIRDLEKELNGWWKIPDNQQVTKQQEPLSILKLPDSGTETANIQYSDLPAISGKHGIVNAVSLGPHAKSNDLIDMHHMRLNLHSYLVRFNGMFWCIWSDGPKIEDWPTQEIKYAKSKDGLVWSKAKSVTGTPKPPNAFIARGLWIRDGELLALAARYRGKGAFGPPKEKQLELLTYRFNKVNQHWELYQKVYDNAINNFPPQKLKSGQWILTRRDSRFNVSVLIGGVKQIDDWKSFPVVGTSEVKKFRPDEPIFWSLRDGTLNALFRDNGGSARLFHSTSNDDGKTWQKPVLTNFPNATSKLFSLKTSHGFRVLVLNANPDVGRRALHLAVSYDDFTFTALAKLDIPTPTFLPHEIQRVNKKFRSGISSLQYPHIIEHDNKLLIALSRNKVQIEVFQVELDDIVRIGTKAN